MARRRRVGPTEEQARPELLPGWPGQVEHGRVRPVLVPSALEGAVAGPAGFRP